AITADCTVTATFSIDTFTVTATAGPNGSLDGTTPSPVTVDYGNTASFTFNSDLHYHVASVDGCSGAPYSNTANSVTTYTYTTGAITADCTVTATFSINTFPITASAGANGSISPSGTVSVNYGDTRIFQFTPDTGYHVSDVIVDGSSVGAVDHYTFTNVTANHSISVAFAVSVPPVIDSFTSDTGSGNSPLTVNFTCIAHDPDGGNIVRYLWQITGRRADTVLTTTDTLAYRFLLTGDYSVSVTVIDEEEQSATADLNNSGIGNAIHVATGEPMSIPIPTVIQMKSMLKNDVGNVETVAVNEFNEAATVTLNAKAESGYVLASATMMVPANGSALLSTDSFTELNYDSVEATADRHLLLFSKISNGTAFMTAELSTWLKSPLYAPHIAEEVDYWNTYAYLSNSNPLMLDVTVAGQTESHTAVSAETIDLESLLPVDVEISDAWGKLMAKATDPFSDIDTLSGFEMFIKEGSDGAATELVGLGSFMLYIPHVPEETDIFWTGFALLNAGSIPATATATFYDDNGNVVGTETLSIPANSKIKGLMADLFSSEAGTARWGTIESNQAINGIEIYGTYNAGICGLTLPSVANTWGILPDVLTGEGNWTGIAITNVTGTDASVTIQLVSSDGTVKREKKELIAAMHRFKAVVAEYFNTVSIEPGDTIHYFSDQPIITLEASGDLDRTFMTALTGSR
ncbi:MAG: hypothetical protein GXO70_00720, partial [Acidobacteria bacterium]|nr:hypothetical protein [Acidobacteriota bacterium]